MSIFSRLTKGDSTPPARIEPVVKATTPSALPYVETPMYFGLNGLFSGGATFSGVVVTPLTAMKSSTVYTCVTTISSSIAKLPVLIKGLDSDGAWHDLPNHALARLFKKPNSRDSSWYQFFNNIITQYLLYGNGYIAIIRKQGEPVEFIGLDSGQVSVTETSTGDRVYKTFSKQFIGKRTSLSSESTDSATRTISSSDMIHLMGPNLNNNLYGQSPINQASEVIGIDLAIQETRAGAFRNGVSIQYVMTTTGRYKPEQLQTIQNEFNKGTSGTANSGASPILPPDIQIHPMTLSVKDLMLPEMGEESKRNVAMLWNYPAHKLGLDDKDAAASIEQKERGYISDTLMPIIKQFEEIACDLCFPDPADRGRFRIEIDTTEMVMPDYKDRVDAGTKAVIGGLIAPNEWRADEGLPGYEGGEEVWRPLNTGTTGQTDGSDTTPAGGMGSNNNDESEEQE